ncbi:MAG: hypothetical protein D3904_04695 [Candidatus Electrothrix sp. EH2]|nr:hypothetical protein [Candidatus Electrothrix sp. EH2]
MKKLSCFFIFCIFCNCFSFAYAQNDNSELEEKIMQEINDISFLTPLNHFGFDRQKIDLLDGNILISVDLDGKKLILNFKKEILDDGVVGGLTENIIHLIVSKIGNVFLNQIEGIDYSFQIEGIPLYEFRSNAENSLCYAQNELSVSSEEKSILVSPGHGYYWNDYYSDWRLQRSYYWGIVEDLVTSEICMYLESYLDAAGFDVRSTREMSKTAGIGESLHSKWEEAGKYYIKSLGVPASVWDSAGSDYDDDIMSRPLYANYIGSDVLVSIHTNAGGGTGTEIWYDSINGYQVESKKLAEILQSNIINSIRSEYDSTWHDRGVKPSQGLYGENYYATRPAVIIELAFHDTQSPDNDALQDDFFKQIVANAIKNGLEEYYGIDNNDCIEGYGATANSPSTFEDYLVNLRFINNCSTDVTIQDIAISFHNTTTGNCVQKCYRKGSGYDLSPGESNLTGEQACNVDPDTDPDPCSDDPLVPGEYLLVYKIKYDDEWHHVRERTVEILNSSSFSWNLFLPAILAGASDDAVPTVTSLTGKIWMDRNLGASRVATSPADEEAYGDLYQWGREKDGHEKRTSDTTTTLSSTDVPGHKNFITTPSNLNNIAGDWRASQNDNLWQGVNGVNNPCPVGFRLPTQDELEEERLSWSSNDIAGAFASPLKFPAAGYRSYDGSFNSEGSVGLYWTGSVHGTVSISMAILSAGAHVDGWNGRAYGFSVRCIKDEPDVIPTVTSPATGRVWMDRNLGASRVATSMTDTEAYGDLYQWGRLTDGHEKRTSGTTATLSSTDVPGHNNFILSPYQPAPSTGDWRDPQNDNLWQGVDGKNNPCPSGFRLPTETELQAEVDSWTTQNIQGAFASPLKLPAAAARTIISCIVASDPEIDNPLDNGSVPLNVVLVQ